MVLLLTMLSPLPMRFILKKNLAICLLLLVVYQFCIKALVNQCKRLLGITEYILQLLVINAMDQTYLLYGYRIMTEFAWRLLLFGIYLVFIAFLVVNLYICNGKIYQNIDNFSLEYQMWRD